MHYVCLIGDGRGPRESAMEPFNPLKEKSGTFLEAMATKKKKEQTEEDQRGGTKKNQVRKESLGRPGLCSKWDGAVKKKPNGGRQKGRSRSGVFLVAESEEEKQVQGTPSRKWGEPICWRLRLKKCIYS